MTPITKFTGKFVSQEIMDNLKDFQAGTECQSCHNKLKNMCNKHGVDFETVTAPQIINILASEFGLPDGPQYMIMPTMEFVYVQK